LMPRSPALYVSTLTITALMPRSPALYVSTLTITALMPRSPGLYVNTLTITSLMQLPLHSYKLCSLVYFTCKERGIFHTRENSIT
jgi:hypothetical protein